MRRVEVLGRGEFLTCVFGGEGKNMVSRLSDTRMQLSVMDGRRQTLKKNERALVSWQQSVQDLRI